MKKISADKISEAVRETCMKATVVAGDDVREALARAKKEEESELGRATLDQLLVNLQIAQKENLPICQDTGLAVFFVERGEEVMIEGATLTEAITEGMRRGYADGYLRKSTCHPFTRKNVGDNSPAVIHYDLVPGDGLKITFMAKGGGAENMSAVGLLKPAQGWPAVRDLVVATVEKAGSNPCPPILVGVGIGGTMEKAAINSKKALLRHLGDINPDPELAALEMELLSAVNRLGIGPEGFGGRVTALAVHIIMQPCHIASLPVAVNLQCHAVRHGVIEL